MAALDAYRDALRNYRTMQQSYSSDMVAKHVVDDPDEDDHQELNQELIQTAIEMGIITPDEGVQKLAEWNYAGEELADLGDLNMVGPDGQPIGPPGLTAVLEQGIVDYINNQILRLSNTAQDQINNQMGIIRDELKSVDDKINSINAKFEGIKAAQDLNDDYVKSEVNKHYSSIQAEVQQHDQTLMVINAGWHEINQKLDSVGTSIYGIQSNIWRFSEGGAGVHSRTTISTPRANHH